MKKLVKMMGLLLIAGAILTGCSDSPKDDESSGKDSGKNSSASSSSSSSSNSSSEYALGVDVSGITVAATQITLANGNWEETWVCNAQNTDQNSTAGKKQIFKYSISGDDIELTQGENFWFQTITCSDDSDLSTRKSNAETVAQTYKMGGKDAKVTVSGRKLTLTVSEALSTTETWHAEPLNTTALISSFPANATIKTNSDNSKYYITWTADYEEDKLKGITYPDASFSAVLIKK